MEDSGKDDESVQEFGCVSISQFGLGPRVKLAGVLRESDSIKFQLVSHSSLLIVAKFLHIWQIQ